MFVKLMKTKTIVLNEGKFQIGQIAGGKRYDLATGGRKRANATFFDAYEADEVSHLEYALDMMPLLENPRLSYSDYVASYLTHFQGELLGALEPFR